MLPTILVSVLLAQGSPTAVGPSVAVVAVTAPSVPDHFTTLFTSVPGAECDGSAVSASGGEALTCTRASGAYCTASSGTMTLLTSDKCRVSNNGLLTEGGRTNITLDSEALGSGNWSGAATVSDNTFAAPWGGTTMDTVASGTGGAARYQCLTISSSAGPFTTSGYGRATSGTHAAALSVVCTGGLTPTTCTCVRADGTSCTTATAAGQCLAYSTFSTTVDRLSVSATCSGPNTQVCLEVLGGDGTATGSHAWGGIQHEIAAFSSSYIPTTGTAVARAADDAHLTPSVAMSSRGCASATVTAGAAPPTSARIVGAAAAEAPLYVASTTTVGVNDGTTTATVSTGTLASTARAVRAGWGGGSETVYFDVSSGTGAFDASMNGGTIYLGSQTATSNFLYGYISNIKLGAKANGCAPDPV